MKTYSSITASDGDMVTSWSMVSVDTYTRYDSDVVDYIPGYGPWCSPEYA